MRLLLAQSDYTDVFKWSILLIVLILGLWIAVSVIRKKLKTDDVTVGTGFTLSDLRQLHKSGQMSTEEYEKAKAILLATMQKPVDKPQTDTKPPIIPPGV